MKKRSETLNLCLYMLLASAVAGSLFGCTLTETFERQKSPSFGYYKSPKLSISFVKKALIVPFAYESGSDKVIGDVTNAFSMEINRVGLFQVVNPIEKPEALIRVGNHLWDRGAIDAKALMQARKDYRVDGFIFGKITHYKPYSPLTLGVRIMFISGDTGETLWSIDGVFDSDQKEIVQMAKKYYKQNYKKDKSLYGWEIMLISMERYTKFIANLLASTMEEAKE